MLVCHCSAVQYTGHFLARIEEFQNIVELVYVHLHAHE